MDAIINDPTFELLGDLSTEGFQLKLYHWLEERGILRSLRTYLRHELISTIKQTHPRSSLLNPKSNHLSPKVHAINILVAEHLLEQSYHFTVSMFHSEEPRLGRFSSQGEPSEGLVNSACYLQMKDVEDILGSLNLRTDAKLGRKVVDIYLSEKKKGISTSLLRSIFKALGETETLWDAGPNFPAGDATSRGNKMNEDQFLSSGVYEEPSIKPTNLGTSAKAAMPGNKEKTESSHLHGENFKRQLVEWNQKEFERRIKEEVLKVKENLEKEAASYKKKFTEDILSTQQQCADKMNQQVKLRLKEIQSKEEELRDKEARLEEVQRQETDFMDSKHSDIVKSHQQLVEGFRRLEAKWKNIKVLEKEMKVWHNQVLGENIGLSPNFLQSNKLEKVVKGDRMGLWQQAGDNISNSDTMNVARSISSMQQETIQAFQQLRGKNEELQMLAEEHQSKIKILTATATQQAKQLEEARAALRLISSRDSHLSDADTKNSLEERLTVLSMMQDDRKGAREGFQKQKEYSESGPSRYKYFDNNPQRKHLRGSLRQHRHRDSDSDRSSASSPTEEVIREARRRLQRLEKESDKVDEQFFKLRQKHLAEAGGSSSGIFPGTLQERDQTLSVYNYVPASQNFAVPVAPPYQLVQGSVAVKIADETSDYQQHQKQDTLVPHSSMKNQAPISSITNVNTTVVHPTLGQKSSGTEFQMGNDPEMSASGVFNNNTPRVSSGTNVFLRESEGNALHTVKSALSLSEGPLGLEHKEMNLVLKSDQRQFFQSQNDFPPRDNQRSVHFATIPDKRNGNNGHIREKNHLSAMSLGTDKHNADGTPEERTQWKTLERGASIMMDSLSTAVDELSKENNNKKDNSDDPPVQSNVLSREANALKAHVSVSTGEDSSSPKLSIGIDGLNDNNSDLW